MQQAEEVQCDTHCFARGLRGGIFTASMPAAGFVSDGGAGGTQAAEHLRLICGALRIAGVSQQVAGCGEGARLVCDDAYGPEALAQAAAHTPSRVR